LAFHLLVDANLSPLLTLILPARLSDVRVEHVDQLGYGSADDERVIALARDRSAILLTEDRGFDQARNPVCTHPGVIVVPRALSFPEVLADHLRRIWLGGYRHLLEHALTRLEADSVRILGPEGEQVLVVRQQRLRPRA
jgi:predicted nuclease of predicted toxin-antitoxin system